MSHPLLANSYGTKPQIIQDDVFPEGIALMDYADEARTLTIGTTSGHLIRLSRDGDQLQRKRGFEKLSHLKWSDSGNIGVAAFPGGVVKCIDADLQVLWDVTLSSNISGLAISPFGSHIAVAVESGRVHIVTTDRKEVSKFEVPRKLDYLHFLHESPNLVAAAEFGHLCCHDLKGRELWQERIMNNVGGMAVSGCGKHILLASFNHGIQVLGEEGVLKGSFQIDGIPDRVAGTSTRRRLAATTIENRIYWLNYEGELQWACDMSADPVACFSVDPMGDRLFVATVTGRLMQLHW